MEQEQYFEEELKEVQERLEGFDGQAGRGIDVSILNPPRMASFVSVAHAKDT